MNLSEIMTQIRGLSYSKKDSQNDSFKGSIPVLRAGNIQYSRIQEEDYVYVSNNLVKDKQYLRQGDVLIAASSGSISIVGKAAMVEYDMDATFGAFCKVLRPNLEKVDCNYFKHFFETAYYKRTIKSLAEGANINNLKTEHFDDLEIPLPPLDQQKKIAAILDAADGFRQKTKALIAKYDELTQSLFLDMFGDPVTNPKVWEEKPISDFIEIIIDYRGKTPPKSKSGIPLLSSANVHKGKIDLSYEQYISYEDYKSWTVRGFTQPGDLLFTTEAPVSEVALIPDDAITYQVSRRVMAMRFDRNRLNNQFALFLMLNKNWSDRLKKVTRGSTVPRVLKPDILEQLLISPPVELQNQFAERVQAIEAQKAQAQESLAKAEDLFNSLLQKAFKGELTK